MTAALVIGADRAFGGEIVEALERDGHAVARSFDEAADVLELLVVNTPVAPRRIRFRDMTDADFTSALEDQLYVLTEAVRFAAPRMAAGGAIVHVGSKAHLGTWDGVELAAAGAACVALVRSLALELRGIRANTLATDFVGERWDSEASRIDLAATVAWLGSASARLISGETILLDSGRSLRMPLAVSGQSAGAGSGAGASSNTKSA
ncbi:SDR family oxidoreductase [Sphingomonas sp.]|jgi:NAD(P)-dependent dehydrogenase (short-subunit alcohol dehydrogenase family)|uniref:SDR family oxidoreductase n=1 Tax=Sphingomonas sp. TaxID=28214 RepID=UPI002ED7C0FF